MKKWMYRVLMLICILVFGFSAYQLYMIYSQEQMIEKETEELKEHVVQENNVLEPDWQKLQAENSDIIAWIYVPDCDISFPVVQTDNNDFYLNHTTQKEYNARGAIFLSNTVSSSFTDDNSLIYGHSVEGGGMFTSIKNFNEKSFFDEHSTFYLLTPNINYECQILTYAKTIDPSVYYTTSFGGYREDVINQFKAEALYSRDVDTADKVLVSLSTCDLDYGFNSDRRLVLTAVLNETKDPIQIEE